MWEALAVMVSALFGAGGIAGIITSARSTKANRTIQKELQPDSGSSAVDKIDHLVAGQEGIKDSLARHDAEFSHTRKELLSVSNRLAGFSAGSQTVHAQLREADQQQTAAIRELRDQVMQLHEDKQNNK